MEITGSYEHAACVSVCACVWLRPVGMSELEPKMEFKYVCRRLSHPHWEGRDGGPHKVRCRLCLVLWKGGPKGKKEKVFVQQTP